MPGGYAYVTLATSDTYSLGALVLAHSLKRVNTPHNLVIMITPGISASMRQLLENAYNEVIEVDILDSKDEANLRLLKRPELGVTFTKLHCWKLINYNKCVFLDADTLVLQNVDDLFERDELSAAPDVGWPDCFNSGVFVFKPSMDTFNDLIKFAIEHGSFDGGDQGLLNMYFSNWGIADIRKHLPFVYNLCSAALYSYLPAFKWFGQNIKIVHFISGSKPWLQSFNPQTRTVQPPIDSPHLKDLLQLWWDIFCVHVHPGLSTEMTENRLNFCYGLQQNVYASYAARPIDDSNSRNIDGHTANVADYEERFTFTNPWDEYHYDRHNETNLDFQYYHHYSANAKQDHQISYDNSNNKTSSDNDYFVDQAANHHNYTTDGGYRHEVVDRRTAENEQYYHQPQQQQSVISFSIGDNESENFDNKNDRQVVANLPTSHNSNYYQQPQHGGGDKVEFQFQQQKHQFSDNNSSYNRNVDWPEKSVGKSQQQFISPTIAPPPAPISHHAPSPSTNNDTNNLNNDTINNDNTNIVWSSHKEFPIDTKQNSENSSSSTVGVYADDNNTNKSGLANAYANVRLDEPSQEQLLLQDQFRRQNWEQGNIDYMGRDAFDNIWAKIQQTIGSNEQEQPPSKSDDDKKSSSVIKDDASTVVTTNQTIKEPTGAKETVSNLEKKTVEISQGKKIEEPSKSSVTQDKPLSKDEAIVKPPTKVSDEAVEKPKETNNELEKKIAAETIKLQEVKPAVETIKDVDKYLSDLEKTTENLQHLDIIEKPALIDESKLKPATRLGSEAVNVVLPEVVPSPVVKPPSDTPLSVEPLAQIPEQKKLKVGVPPSLVQSSVPFAPAVVSSAPRVEQPTIPPLSPTSVKHEAVNLQSGKEQESSHKSSSSGKDEIAAPVSPVKSPPISVLTKEDVAIKLSSSDKESDKQPKTAAPPPAKQIKSPLPLDSPTTESKPLGTPSIESPKISQPTGSQQQQKQQQQSGKSKDSGKPSAAASSGKKK